jgi:hypothetical protein
LQLAELRVDARLEVSIGERAVVQQYEVSGEFARFLKH